MPQIIDYAYNYTTSTTGTTVACDVPNTATGDILVAILTQDTGTTPTWTSTGWTQYFTLTNTSATALMWRVSTGAAEPASYTFTTNSAESLNCIMISIRDVDTVTPFVTQTSANRASHNTAFPSITTNRADSLILYISGHPSTAAIPSSIEGPVTQLFQMDGLAHSDSVGWGFKRAIGATGATVISSVSGTTYGGSLITLAIRPPAAGATLIPAYCTADNSLYLDPLHGTTAFRGNTAPASTNTVTTYTGTIATKSLAVATVAARTDTGINSFRSTAGQTSSINRTWQGFQLQFAAAKTTLAGKNILAHIKPYLPADIQTLEGIGLERGVAVGLHSSNGNYKVWHVHGANTVFGTIMAPVVVNTGALGAIQTTGALNTASITGIGFFVSGFVASADMIWTMAWALDTTTVCGGNSITPIDVPGIVRAIANGKERMSALQQGKNQMLVLQPFQIGNGGTDQTYLDISTAAIEFPQQYNVAASQVYYNSTDNVCGVTFFPGSTDTINIQSSVWSSSSKFHWGFNSASSAVATVLTDGSQVIGAGTITMSANVNILGMTFSRCSEITSAGNTLTNCIFSSSTATTGAISITGASQAALQTALGKLSSCTFSGNTIPTGALRIIYTGTAGAISLSMSSNTFSGNTADIRWEAPAASNLTINLSGTASVSTFSATNSNTVTFSNPKQFVVTNIVEDSEVRIYKSSDLSDLGGCENANIDDVPTTTPINVVVAADIDNPGRFTVTYAFNYTVDTPITIVVLNNAYQVVRQTSTLKNENSSLQVNQLVDRQYLNP
jgi:hypothetical protein